jgi:glycosyltransferase involved in cell wall biosynthesis
MATVIRLLTEHNVGADFAEAHPTWHPESMLMTARLFVATSRTLFGLPSSHIAHVHLSERGSFLREGSMIAIARRRGLTTVATIHGASFLPFARRYPRYVSSVLRQANLVTCLDRATLEFVRQHAAETRSELVPNPVFVDSEYIPADTTEELVVFAGEIGLRKGAHVLSRAWQLVADQRPNARCLMVGPIADFTPPDMERLVVLPSVGAREMKGILRSARVVALPSRAEGTPMVLAEAMSQGRPFVATPVGGIPELASTGGLLVTVDDELQLANCLVSLLADPELARTIGESGRRFCRDTRGIEIMDIRFRELYSAATTD